MKEKVDSDLEPVEGENILYEAHPSMFRNQPLWFVILVLLSLIGFAFPFLPFETSYLTKFLEIAIPMVIGLIAFLAWWLKCKATTLTVTSERTSCRRGILSKSITEVWHQDVRNVQLDQSLLQRILDVGTIGISSAAQSGLEISVSGVPHPEKVKALIDTYRRRD
ncbi:PH domain-containing protein [Mariniblastus fucicola]|uniref:Bacterial membrane flanked domain protein n=1 Tax=Mariniblastus fucicola TaxID=980251 RepID=A0A5B9PJC8_9BACT|nr:PH domain-containing protein [Mariniblastus fucicola]QEG22791.1 Bacterial membrane flanked domain protein [Mariniblastus fucicola]